MSHLDIRVFKEKFMKQKDKQKLLNKTNLTKSSECANNSENQSSLEKIVKDCLGTILEYHPLILSGVSLVSVFFYFLYFFNIGYFPALSGSDVFYFGGLIFFGSFPMALLFIMPSIFYPGYRNNKTLFTILLAISSLPLLALICELALLNVILNSPDISLSFKYSLLISFIISAAYIMIIGCIDKFGKEQYIKVLSGALIVMLLIVTPWSCKIEKSILFISIFLVIGFICTPPLFLYMSKDIYDNNGYKWLLASMAIAAPIYSSLAFASSIAGWLEISNINYKYLIVEKSALGALPDEISQNDTNIGNYKTYYDEDKISGTIKLHNIKALSTLGKFYYLETKDGVKFELDSSKIISRAKE